mmetsp:Transcript_18954/g.48199  ORF Transcript_18954/g.48199 Transcript_18954/m.48199 type:complete len:244 (+) Transcript_18954:2209-2940(+)
MPLDVSLGLALHIVSLLLLLLELALQSFEVLLFNPDLIPLLLDRGRKRIAGQVHATDKVVPADAIPIPHLQSELINTGVTKQSELLVELGVEVLVYHLGLVVGIAQDQFHVRIRIAITVLGIQIPTRNHVHHQGGTTLTPVNARVDLARASAQVRDTSIAAAALAALLRWIGATARRGGLLVVVAAVVRRGGRSALFATTALDLDLLENRALRSRGGGCIRRVGSSGGGTPRLFDRLATFGAI